MTLSLKSRRRVEQRTGRVSAGCGQHVAGQRSLRCRSRRASRTGVRRRRAPALLGPLRAKARPARPCRLPGQPAGVSQRPRRPARSARDVGVFARIPLHCAAVPARTRCRGALEHSRPNRGAVGRRHRISAAQDSALRHLGRGRRTRYDLLAQGTRARPCAAALTREPLFDGGRQAEPFGCDEIHPEGQADDGIRAPGTLRIRRGVPSREPCAGHDDRANCGSDQPHFIRLPGTSMSITKNLHDLGQSIWLDNITREILDNGPPRRHIDSLSVTGLPSTPTIFDEAIGNTSAYDGSIRQKAQAGLNGEELFVELALEDLRRAADLFRPVFDRTGGIDGWVSMEVSPLLANDTKTTIDAALAIHKQANRPNLYIKIPGTPAGVPAIEAAIFAGVPGNVALLFSREHYLSVAEAYLRGIERRIAAGLDPRVNSVASLFVSRWDRAVADRVPPELRNRLGIAVAARAYVAHNELLQSKRWRGLEAAGARKQRMLWASTGTKDPKAPPGLYVEALAAPDTIDTMPEKTLLAFAAGGSLESPMRKDGGDAEQVLAEFARAGIDVGALAVRLQSDGADSFVKSWRELMERIAEKSAVLATS